MVGPALFRLPKEGSTRAEYEDAMAWSRRAGRFAVADGASASAFARLWAQLLVQGYVGGRLQPDTIEADLAPFQSRWSRLVEGHDLPWYAVEQARRGAFAALAGLSIDSRGEWSALAVGDCCIFQVRDDALITAWPFADADAFDNRPLLLGSRPAANNQLREQDAIFTTRGTWRAEDTFLLMSDALAATFLRQLQLTSIHDALAFERSPAGFRRWICSLRSERALRNDDVSLMWLVTPELRDAAA